MDARAQPVQRLAMFRHRVALVAFEAVARAIQRQRAHQAVARHLGDDRCRRDRHHDAVAADHRVAVAGRVDPVAAVDEDMLRHLGQRAHGARQRPERGAQDIVAIDSRRRGKGDRKGRCRADFLEQFLAALRRQSLEIVDALRDPLRIEHDRGGHHRSGQRTPPRLVAAGHRPDAALDQRPLPAKARRRDRDDALGQRGRFLAGLRRGLLLSFPGGLVPNHAAMVRKRVPARNREPGTIPVIQSLAEKSSNPAGEPGGPPRTSSTAARFASAWRNDRSSVSRGAC